MKTNTITLEGVTLCYPSLFEPQTFDGSAPSYNATVLVSKNDETFANAWKGFKTAKEAELGVKLKTHLKDGDAMMTAAEEEGTPLPECYANCWVFSCKKKAERGAPGLLDENKQVLLDRNRVFGGMRANVSVNIYAYEFSGSKGAAFGLNHVMVLQGGTRLGGGVDAEEAFADVAKDENKVEATTSMLD